MILLPPLLLLSRIGRRYLEKKSLDLSRFRPIRNPCLIWNLILLSKRSRLLAQTLADDRLLGEHPRIT